MLWECQICLEQEWKKHWLDWIGREPRDWCVYSQNLVCVRFFLPCWLIASCCILLSLEVLGELLLIGLELLCVSLLRNLLWGWCKLWPRGDVTLADELPLAVHQYVHRVTKYVCKLTVVVSRPWLNITLRFMWGRVQSIQRQHIAHISPIVELAYASKSTSGSDARSRALAVGAWTWIWWEAIY